MSNAEIVQKVMEKVEEFYMGNEDDSGEALFNNFAEKHAEKFTVEEGQNLADVDPAIGVLVKLVECLGDDLLSGLVHWASDGSQEFIV